MQPHPYQFALLTGAGTDAVVHMLRAVGSPIDPLDYRPLLLLPVLYRRWASMRLWQLRHWIRQWELPEMYAGVRYRGAAEAWWRDSLTSERLAAQSVLYASIGIDLWKCFDQLPRELIVGLAVLAGFPKQVVDVYLRFHHALHI